MSCLDEELPDPESITVLEHLAVGMPEQGDCVWSGHDPGPERDIYKVPVVLAVNPRTGRLLVGEVDAWLEEHPMEPWLTGLGFRYCNINYPSSDPVHLIALEVPIIHLQRP